MAGQVIPLTDLASMGVMLDAASSSLPPNAFSNVSNVRFNAGAVRKMEGELAISLTSCPTSEVEYIAYWQGPTNSYYVVVHRHSSTIARIYAWSTSALGTRIQAGEMTTSDAAKWSHTTFNGGFHFIINNSIDAPKYLSDPIGTDSIALLPNWDSYLSESKLIDMQWDAFNADIPLNVTTINFDTHYLLYTVKPVDPNEAVLNFKMETLNPSGTPVTINNNGSSTENTATPRARTATDTGALPGDTIQISILTRPSINVRCGVIRSYGNSLIAGDLTETAAENYASNAISVGDVIRKLPGVIRTSDVAAPGNMPTNWNPFRNGANTADEFTLSGTGAVTDMAELQGVMYVYTNHSIHSIQKTNNNEIPYVVSPVTESYGANCIGAVKEYDGRHIVVGSDDVYMFSGNPGNIQSIADLRVRHYLHGTSTTLNPDDIRIIRNRKYDELWFYTPSSNANNNEVLIWNYRTNAWTKRAQTNIVCADVAPYSGNDNSSIPIITNAASVFYGDVPGNYTLKDGSTVYDSYVERERLALTPEFDTEELSSIALLMSGSQDLNVELKGTARPQDETGVTNGSSFTFSYATDYKVDTRIQGRFLNYKIGDQSATTGAAWSLTNLQLEIMKGGTR